TYSATADEEMSLEDYLGLCKKDPTAYATASERMLASIGEPEFFDTRNDPRLSRIFSNRLIRRYPAFREFFGMEDAIDQIVSFFRHAAQGLEERKQILYLLGPVGGGKSSLAERSGRVQLFGWVMPREPGHPRIRRDVQGADQDAASPLDRHAGGELQGDRRLLGDTVQRHHRRPLERIGVAYLPQQQEQRGF